MAKIQFPKGDVWVEIPLETSLITPPILKIKIKPTFKRDQIKRILRSVDITKEKIEEGQLTKNETVDTFEESAKMALEKVTAWDLDDDKGKILCTTKNKEKYLDPLLWEDVEKTAEEIKIDKALIADKKKPKPKLWLWSKILDFASNMENFSKN